MGSNVEMWAPIPGETPIDPSGLRDRSIGTRAELNKVEAENIRKAYVKYLTAKPTRKYAPFNYDWLFRLHYEMLHEVWEWAGKPRTRELNIGVTWSDVPQQLGALVLDLETWCESSQVSLIEQSARLHHRAVWIHPFYNGNGRWARMLAGIWLRLHSGPLLNWPEEHIEEASIIRDEYLATLRKADEGNFAPLTELHQEYASDT